MDNQQLRYNIRKIREIKGYSQEYLAKELGVSIKTYSRVESGQSRLPVSRLDKISEILDVTPTAIMEFRVDEIFNQLNE